MENNIYNLDDGVVRDEVMRCHNCKSIISREVINQKGHCNKCHNRKFTLVTYFTDKEFAEWKDKLDPEFLELFTEES